MLFRTGEPVELVKGIAELENDLLKKGNVHFIFNRYSKPHGYAVVENHAGLWHLHPESLKSRDLPIEERRFILWNSQRDGILRYPEDDHGGILGKITHKNVYLTTYAQYPDDRRPEDLLPGNGIEKVRYSLSGETGYYAIYRVV